MKKKLPGGPNTASENPGEADLEAETSGLVRNGKVRISSSIS